MARRQIAKPRFYADIFSYLKSIGMYYGVMSNKFQEDPVENKEKVFTMNPYQPYDYQLESSSNYATLDFFSNQDPEYASSMAYLPEYELGKLLAYHNNSDDDHHTSGWYAGVLGHNFASVGVTGLFQTSYGKREDGTVLTGHPEEAREIINYGTEGLNCVPSAGTGKPKYDGFSLWEVTNKDTGNLESRYNTIRFELQKEILGNVNSPWGEENFAKIGAYTCGIFFEPEHSFELSATTTYSHEGIKNQNTVGGSTITNINYLGVPNWGNQPAWTLQKTDGRDYTTVANRGRRQWQVGLSFIADNNMFDKVGNANKFYNDSFTDGVEDAYSVDNFDTSLSSFFKLTHMGNLPFIFCPDSKADNLEFALCRITNKPSFKQVANNLFSTSLVITESW